MLHFYLLNDFQALATWPPPSLPASSGKRSGSEEVFTGFKAERGESYRRADYRTSSITTDCGGSSTARAAPRFLAPAKRVSFTVFGLSNVL